jgi:hypothetical protein
VRITAQLIETQTGACLLADRFNFPLEDIFELQDQIAANVAGVIEPALQAAEIRRSTERPRMISPHTICNCARFTCPGKRMPSSGRSTCWSGRSSAILTTLWHRLRCATTISTLTAGPPTRGESRSSHPSRLAGAWSRWWRPRGSRHFVFCACLLRRGHPCHNSIGRPCPRARSKFRSGLAAERLA